MLRCGSASKPFLPTFGIFYLLLMVTAARICTAQSPLPDVLCCPCIMCNILHYELSEIFRHFRFVNCSIGKHAIYVCITNRKEVELDKTSTRSTKQVPMLNGGLPQYLYFPGEVIGPSPPVEQCRVYFFKTRGEEPLPDKAKSVRRLVFREGLFNVPFKTCLIL